MGARRSTELGFGGLGRAAVFCLDGSGLPTPGVPSSRAGDSRPRTECKRPFSSQLSEHPSSENGTSTVRLSRAGRKRRLVRDACLHCPVHDPPDATA